MKKHMDDYNNFDFNDMEDFVKYFDLARDFLFVLNHIEKEETNSRLDNLINDLQSLRHKSNRHKCLINLDLLIDTLIDEDCYAYDEFNDFINDLNNGTLPNREDMLDDYIRDKIKEIGAK